jgi:antirepressor, phage associated
MKKGEARVLKVKTFRNKPFGKVRTVAVGDRRWLLLEDVCTVMGFLYDRTLNGFLEPDDVWYEAIRDDKGEDRIVAVIGEPGLCMMATEAQSEKAEAVCRWIQRDVLTVVSWESENPDESETLKKFRDCVAKGMTETKKAGVYAAEMSVNAQTMSGWKRRSTEHFINLILYNVGELVRGEVAINDWLIPEKAVDIVARAEMYAGYGLSSAKDIRQEDVGKAIWKLREVKTHLRRAKRYFAEAKELTAENQEDKDCIRTDALDSEWDAEWGES